jgi:hypothetical protein
VLVTKGRSKRSLLKFKQYRDDNRCVIIYSQSGWFTYTEILTVLDIIYNHTKGAPALCIWDDYAAHNKDQVLEKAKKLNISLLTVPKGMTPSLQPLDFKVFGAFKPMMNSYWLKNSYNTNSQNYHTNLCETILNCYENISSSLIRSSFECMSPT